MCIDFNVSIAAPKQQEKEHKIENGFLHAIARFDRPMWKT